MTTAFQSSRPAWFVGADWDGQDQTNRFVGSAIWENGYHDRYVDLVKSIAQGDQIAIKSAYVRRDPNGLPFDNRGHSVSVMGIKATGIVTKNMGDGRRLQVDWTRVNPPREWYFYTYRGTVWEVQPGTWATDQLIAFTFENQDQDIDGFRTDQYWRERFGDPDHASQQQSTESTLSTEPTSSLESPPPQAYTIDDIITDGCFLDRSMLERMLERLETKQNIILQGPPGAGKSWLSKRLAYTLIGFKDDSKIRQMQFHPNLSYEDFVRGYRPQSAGKLDLADGPFLQLCDTARRDRSRKYVIVIEEINRGNPASIFGELLTLLEADKRVPNDALALAYSRDEYERFHIPPNVYVIGTMNLADRSLALVDIALRRRFAFFDLEPAFNETWLDWVRERFSETPGFAASIKQRIDALNSEIARDSNLGDQFRIGHSHFTPAPDATIGEPREWYKDVVQTEIAPLLREYWFDNESRAQEETEKLTAGL